MKKSLLWFSALTILTAVSACGNSREKSAVLARIDGKTFTEADFALRLATLEEARIPELLANEEQRRREFNSFLEKRLQALAGQKSPLGKSADLRRRLASMDKRVMTQYYFETHINLFGGYTRAQVEAYFDENPSRFADDSGKVPAFGSVLMRVADSMLIRDGALDSFYTANRRNYAVRPWVEVSVIRTSTRAQAEAAQRAVRGGDFAAAAEKHSVHHTRDNGGRIPRLNLGEYHDAFGSQSVIDSLLFNESTRLKPGRASGIVRSGDAFLIVRVEAHHPEHLPELADIFPQAAGDYLRATRERMNQSAVERLRARYDVLFPERDLEPTERELRDYYAANSAQFMTPERFELYHIAVADTAELSRGLQGVDGLPAFRALASRISENKLTKPRDGHLGLVSRDHALPFGVGVLPALFPALDEIEDGLVGELVEDPATRTWHAFWLVSKTPAAEKPFDRVRASIAQEVKNNRVSSYEPGDTLAIVKRTGRIIRESDVQFLRREIPAHVQERYTRESLVDYVIVWDIFSAEARALGLDKEPRLQAMRLQNEDNFWSGVFRDSILTDSWGQKPSKLKKQFKAQRDLFTQDADDTWAEHARDVAASLQLTDSDYRIEYHTYPERYTRDSTLTPFDEAESALFANLKPVAYARLDDAVLEGLKKRFKVRVYDATLQEPSLEPVEESYKRAQDLHYERRLDQALALYERLRAAYPKRTGLQDSVSFGIAQIQIEMERYPQAMAEYRRVSYLNPEGPNDYKAMFMVGFIQAEHLRQDSAAVRSFEAMLKKHPDSDLSDDADWMIRNIRSGGELMPLLEDDAEFEEEGAEQTE